MQLPYLGFYTHRASLMQRVFVLKWEDQAPYAPWEFERRAFGDSAVCILSTKHFQGGITNGNFLYILLPILRMDD